jgi:hypothetical protein
MSEDTGEVVLKKRPHSCICGVPCSEEFKSLAEKLVEALLFVVNEHKLSNRELLRMGARPNKPCATVLKALEALSLAREMGVLK